LTESGLTILDAFSTEGAAELALARLSAAGIRGCIRKDALGVTYGVGSVAVLVAHEDLEMARRVLSEERPSEEQLETEALQSREPEASPPLLAGPSAVAPGGMFLLGLLVGAVLIGFAWYASGRSPHSSDGEQTIDENGDGKADAWYFRTGGVLTASQFDRNFDGAPDVWRRYENGVETVDRWDNNFDGHVDREMTYSKHLPDTELDDRDFDGRWDAWRRYEGYLVTYEAYDSDGDGEADETGHFEKGQLVFSESDKNGDGKPDYWCHYRQGELASTEWDTDRNGVPDLWTRCASNGNREFVEVRPNGAVRVTRRLVFKDGLLVEEWADHDGDGRLEEKRTYDAFMTPSPPQRVGPAQAQDGAPTIVSPPRPTGTSLVQTVTGVDANPSH